MLFGSLLVLFLGLAWYAARHPPQWLERPTVPWGKKDLLPLMGLLFAQAPIAWLLWTSRHAPAFLPGDAGGHAMAVQTLDGISLLRGWVGSLLGGFPLAIHYPVLGWLLALIPTALGVSAATSTLAVGILGLAALPLTSYAATRFAGARRVSSFLGAVALSWVSPINPFVGGYEAFVSVGLLAQVVSLPLVVLWAVTTLRGRSLTGPALPAVLTALAHPQVAVMAAVLLALVSISVPERSRTKRLAVGIAASTVTLILVYGPGLSSLHLPFGWPPMPSWTRLGFASDRFFDWLLDGDLFDRNRAPWFTATWGISCLALLPLLRRPSARAALVASVASLGLALSGPPLSGSGELGQAVLGFLQPLRALALLPLVASFTLVVTLELWSEVPVSLWRDLAARIGVRRRWIGAALSVALLALTLTAAGRSRFQWARDCGRVLVTIDGEHPCGPKGPDRQEFSRLKTALGKLERGRLWIDVEGESSSVLVACASRAGLTLASAVPLSTTPSVGAHLGLEQQAANHLDPERPGSAARAEALGVRYLLTERSVTAKPSEDGWKERGGFGPLLLLERMGGSDLFGLACARRVLSGPEPKIRSALYARLANPAGEDELLNPRTPTEIRIENHPLRVTEQQSDCRLSGAKLDEFRRPPGRLGAAVESPAPVDLVMRVTAFPWWSVRVDVQPVTPRLVAPGFMLLHLPAGRHHIEADVRWPVWIPLSIVLCIAGAAWLSLSGHKLWL